MLTTVMDDCSRAICGYTAWPVRFTVCADNEDVELGVVGLPYLVRPLRSAAVYEFVPVAVGRRPLEGEGDESGIQGRNDVPNGRMPGHRSVPLSGIGDGEPVQGCKARARFRQGESLDERHGFRCGVAPAGIDSGTRIQRRDSPILKQPVPALKRTQADLRFPGQLREGDLIFDVQSKDPPPLRAIHERSYIAVLSRAARACW